MALMCKEAVERVTGIEHWGCPFSRTDDGRIAQRHFGGGAFPRAVYAADRTGHALLNTLYEQCIKAKANGLINFYDEWHVISIITSDSACYGVTAYNLRDSEIRAFPSNAVIIATGGAGRIYLNSTAFRFSCRGSVCGSCAMNINNGYRLACETRVERLGNTVKIRPLSHMPIIKDLVVDMERFWVHYESIRPYLLSNRLPDKENIISPAERKKLDGLIECILCGLCVFVRGERGVYLIFAVKL